MHTVILRKRTFYMWRVHVHNFHTTCQLLCSVVQCLEYLALKEPLCVPIDMSIHPLCTCVGSECVPTHMSIHGTGATFEGLVENVCPRAVIQLR